MIRRLLAAPEALTIEWADGGVSEFASLWLRDNRPGDRDAHSGQRLIDIADLPERPLIRAAVSDNGMVRIEWDGETPAASFEVEWLAAHAFGRGAHTPELQRRLWLEGAKLSDARRDFACVSLGELRAEPRAARLELAHAAVAGWPGVARRRAGDRGGDPRGSGTHRPRARDQLWPDVRRSLGRATGRMSRLFLISASVCTRITPIASRCRASRPCTR